jgi:hypothetical protein
MAVRRCQRVILMGGVGMLGGPSWNCPIPVSYATDCRSTASGCTAGRRDPADRADPLRAVATRSMRCHRFRSRSCQRGCRPRGCECGAVQDRGDRASARSVIARANSTLHAIRTCENQSLAPAKLNRARLARCPPYPDTSEFCLAAQFRDVPSTDNRSPFSMDQARRKAPAPVRWDRLPCHVGKSRISSG